LFKLLRLYLIEALFSFMVRKELVTLFWEKLAHNLTMRLNRIIFSIVISF